jgi:hypothetical protein
MRTIFDQGPDMKFGFPGTVNDSQNSLRGSIEKPRAEGSSYVKLEIHIEALQRLIDRHALKIEDIQCVDQRSKNIVRSALLIGLLDSKNIDA